jgi:superfamily I DNA and RNA helicase
MQVFPSRSQFQSNPASAALLNCLLANEPRFGLTEAMLYYAFPLYRDDEGGAIVADAMLLSPQHGVIVFALTTESHALSGRELQRCSEVFEQVPPYVQSRLVKNKQLRRGPTSLAFEITPLVYAPLFTGAVEAEDLAIAASDQSLGEFLDTVREQTTALPPDTYKELISTIEGAKGLIRPKKRDLPSQDESSKGKQAEIVEAVITLFDQQQKHGMMGRTTGPQRIRGLAGSGKTVVLAMKAAQTYLQNPDAKIAYTFYTKSLYQHVKRLITRFYRQFDDQDPDWEKHVHVLHGWGGANTPGLYSVACEEHGVPALTFQQAAVRTFGDHFDYACSQLMATTKITPIYDYVFVDEGQDFPTSFVRLCHALAKDGKFVLAYDDLQTIFQVKTPSAAEVLGPDATFEEDIVLHKCYRNPREVLVSAHALGFGIYGRRIVQMLASRDHWEDIGYIVREGEFVEGSRIVVERPAENSLTVISDRSGFDEIIKAAVFENMDQEMKAVAESIKSDLADGLQPEDVLIVCVDDRHAKGYLSGMEMALLARKIQCNNLHTDSFGIRDFSKQGRVTLSTVHKAKGNEAFMVYVIGVDALMHTPDVRRRNMLFTAMTRAKGWVRISGTGDGAKRCIGELKNAKEHYPTLVFKYPGPEELKIMERDLAETADKKLKARRLIEQLQEDFSDEEIEEILQERRKRRGSRHRKVHGGDGNDR